MCADRSAWRADGTLWVVVQEHRSIFTAKAVERLAKIMLQQELIQDEIDVSQHMNDRPGDPPPKLAFPLSLMMPLALLVFAAGITWWIFHLGRIEAAERVRSELRFFALTSLMAIGLGLFFHLAVVRRIKRLARVAQQFGSGTLVRSGVGGRDVVGRRKDGTEFPLELSVSEIKLADKRIFPGFVRDLTERQRSQELEQDLGRILESSLNEIYICSAETMRFVQVNRGARENIGYTMDELRELTPVDIEPEFTAESLREFAAPLLSGEQKRLVVETLHRRKDGSLYEAEVHVQITTYQGQPAFVAMALDITDRKRLEHEIRLQGQALDTGATAITFASLDGRLTYVNKAFRKMWGYASDDELIGRPASDLSSSEEDVGEVMKGLREHGEWVGERVAKRKDGSLFEMQVSASTVTSDDGEPIAMMASFVDISDLKRVEASLARLNEELEQRVEERSRQLRDTQQQLVRKEKLATLGQLAGTVAHEIRNPLAIIKNAAYFLQGEMGADQDTRDAFGEIDRALYTSNRIVSELLDYARDPKLETTDFPPAEVVNRALSAVTIPDNILVDPEFGDSNFRLRADAGQVERMLINLIQNAVQAMSQGGKLTIRCRQVTEGQAEIEVKDTGHGIEQNDLQKVFEPLFSSKVKGIGLGLTLCKRYAELNHGKLSVESELELGSTFRLTLPCARETQGE